jgi:hypothetical protein
MCLAGGLDALAAPEPASRQGDPRQLLTMSSRTHATAHTAPPKSSPAKHTPLASSKKSERAKPPAEKHAPTAPPKPKKSKKACARTEARRTRSQARFALLKVPEDPARRIIGLCAGKPSGLLAMACKSMEQLVRVERDEHDLPRIVVPRDIASIQAAVETLSEGTIAVSGGIYNERLYLHKDVKLVATSQSAPWILRGCVASQAHLSPTLHVRFTTAYFRVPWSASTLHVLRAIFRTPVVQL